MAPIVPVLSGISLYGSHFNFDIPCVAEGMSKLSIFRLTWRMDAAEMAKL